MSYGEGVYIKPHKGDIIHYSLLIIHLKKGKRL